MKIKSIRITNFRSIADDIVECEDFNGFVGPNGSGKSTALNALNVFFGEITSFNDRDFHNRDTNKPFSIKVTFHELGPEAEEEFRHYVRSGLLVVTVEILKQADGTFKKSVFGERMVFEPFKPFFEAKTAGERGKIFKDLLDNYKIEPATNDEGRRASLLSYEESLPESDKVLTQSGAEFFGVSKGVHKFQRHISWVYVPAVKDAASESEEAKSSHLGKLIQHTIRSGMDYEGDLEKIRADALEAYEKLLSGQRTHLTTLQKRLAERLQAAVTTDADLSLDWKKDQKSVAVQEPIAQVLLTDKGFSGEVENFGHGLQRSFLIVILQELMTVDSDVSPTLILACEEPELYQHPPQAKHLAAILMELSEGDAQVFITTHSPYFIDVDFYEGIKMFRYASGKATISKSSFNSILHKYNTAFDKKLNDEDQVRTKLAIQTQPKFNEIFFADKIVLIEGISDEACLETYLRLSGRRKEFQKSGAALLVCEGKSSLAIMLLIARDFKIPYYVVLDCDAHCEEKHKADHIRDNDAIFALADYAKLGKLPDSHIFEAALTGWHHDIEQVIEEEFGLETTKFNQAGRDAVGNLKSSKKNPLYIAAAMKCAWDDGRKFSVLDKVIDGILKI